MTKISNQYSLTNVLFADAVNGRVGIGTTSPTVPLDVVGAGKFSSSVTTAHGASGNNGGYIINYSPASTASRSWRIINDQVAFGDFAIQQSTTQTGTSYNQPFYINPSGNVGIGTTSPDAKLNVVGGRSTFYANSEAFAINVKYNSSAARGYWIGSPASGIMSFSNADGTERLRITDDGNVGIGTSSPFNTNGYTSFTINGTTGSIIEMLANGTRAMQIVAASSISYFYGALNTPMAWYTNANERMRITEGGDVCVATTSSSYSSANRGNITIGGGASALLAFQTGGVGRAYAYHDGSNYSIVNNASGGGIYMSSNSGGVVLSSGATSWASSSDERLKNINSNIEDAVSKLSSLRAVNFSWKSDETQKEVLGLIAQDVEKVFPQVVDKSKLSTNIDEEQIDKTEYLGVRYTELVPVLVKAIQELSAQASEQQTQINELKALLNA